MSVFLFKKKKDVARPWMTYVMLHAPPRRENANWVALALGSPVPCVRRGPLHTPRPCASCRSPSAQACDALLRPMTGAELPRQVTDSPQCRWGFSLERISSAVPPRPQVTSKVFRQLTKALRFAPCQRCREQLLCSHLPFYIMTTSQSLQLPKHTKLRHVFTSVSIYFHFRLAPYFSCCLPDEVLVIFTIQLSWQLFDLGEEPWLGRPSSPLPRPVLSVLICLFRTWAVSNSRAGPASYGSFCPHQCLERCRFSKIKPKHCDTVRERGDHYSVCPSVQTNCSVSSLNFALHKATKRTCCRCSLFADSTTANRLAR